MLVHVLASVHDSGIARRTIIVTTDRNVQARAASWGCDLVFQHSATPGLNKAIDLGRIAALESDTEDLLVLFGDLPLLEARDLRNLARRDSGVIVATDRHGSGTNALLLRGGAVRTFDFQFGERSRFRHLEEADRLGLDALTVIGPGTGIDLDTLEDFAWLLDEGRQLPEAVRQIAVGVQEMSA